MTIDSTLGQSARSLWWLVLIRGILLVVLGVLAFLQPIQAVVIFTLVVGIYAIADGILVIVASIATRKQYSGWGWLLAQGVLTILAGLIIVALPGFTGAFGILAIVWFLVFSTLIGGVFELVAAFKHHGSSRGWGIAAGVVDILFAILLAVLIFTSPAGTILATIWLIGVGAIVFGITFIVGAFRLRSGKDAGYVVDEYEKAVDGV